MIGRRSAAKLAAVLVAGSLLGSVVAPPSAQAVTLSDDRGRSVELARPAQRVVSLLPSLTESICELGACSRLVGVDRHSNWPASLRDLPRLGGLEDLQVERLVALRPDLVVAAGSTRALERLDALGVPVLALEPRSMADLQRVLATLGRALGDEAAADASWRKLQSRLDLAATRVPATMRGRSVYFEVAAVPFAASAGSFVGELLQRLHLRNVVPASMGPFPQINPEFVLRARPDLVMATATAVAEMPRRPGWSTLPALQRGQTCGFDSVANDALMRPGPRLAEAADAIAACLVRLAAGEGR